jgi:hypothetical protein
LCCRLDILLGCLFAYHCQCFVYRTPIAAAERGFVNCGVVVSRVVDVDAIVVGTISCTTIGGRRLL